MFGPNVTEKIAQHVATSVTPRHGRVLFACLGLLMPAFLAIILFQQVALAQGPSDLVVVVNDGGQPIVAGDPVTYTIDFGLVASSSVTATNLSLTQTLSDVISFQSCTFTPTATGICTPTVTGLTIAVDRMLRGGDSGQVQVAALISATADGAVLSVVEFSATDQATTLPLTTTQASVTTQIDPAPPPPPPILQVGIDDGAGGQPVVAGELFTYTIDLGVEATNPGTAQNLVIAQTLANGVIFQSCLFPSAVNGTCTFNGTGIDIALNGEMQHGESSQVHVIVAAALDVSGPAVSTLDFAGVDKATTLPLNSVQANVTTQIDPPPPAPILHVGIDDGAGGQPIVAGQPFTYTIDFGVAATNPGTAQNLSIAQTLATETTFQSCRFPLAVGGTCTPNGTGIDIALNGEMQHGESGQVQVVVLSAINASGAVTSTVDFAGVDKTTTLPLTSTHAAVGTYIGTPPALQITINDGVDDVEPGGTVTYMLTLSNEGDLTATGVEPVAILPAGIALISTSDGGGADPVTPGLVTWPGSDLTGHTSITRTMAAQVDLPLDEAISTLTITANANFGGLTVAQASDEDRVTARALTGVVWHDLNGDGAIQSDEAGIGNIPVQISGRGETFAPLFTTGDGSFRLASLGAGDYMVNLDLSTLPDYSIKTGSSAPVTVRLATTQTTATVNFGLARPGSISGTLWIDDNGDGIWTDGEPLLADTPLILTDGGGTALGNAITDAQGVYRFLNLAPATYHVQVDTASFPAGYTGTYEIDNVYDQDVSVTMLSSANVADVDFGFAFAGHLGSGRIWRDNNQNGVIDEGEQGLPDVQVDLIRANDGLVRSFVTDASGDFRFGGFAPGDYRLAVASTTWNPQTGVTADPDAALDGWTDIIINAGEDVGPFVFGYGPLDLRVHKETAIILGQTGERVRYRLNYANQGRVDAGAARITEYVPANSTFDATYSSPGWTCADGSIAGALCELDLGVVPIATTGAVTFTVRIVDAMPARLNTITNTVTVADVTPGFTDIAPIDNRAAITLPVDAAPLLLVNQTDGGLRTEPGQTLAYTITYGNEGNQHASGVQIVQTTPQNTHFDASQSTPGWDCPDGSPAGTDCTLTIGGLMAGDEGEVVFAATLENAMPVNVATIDAVVSIYDDGDASDIDAELTPVDATPDLVVNSVADAAEVAPGMLLQYTLAYTNSGNQDAIGVLLVHTVPDFTTFVPSLSSSAWDCPDGLSAGVQCLLAVGGLKAFDDDATYFTVRVDENIPPDVTAIQNSVVIAGSGIEQNISNNHSGGVIGVTGPSAIDLISFTATTLAGADGPGLLVRWETSAERDSWGFYVHRSTSSDWESAMRISPTLVRAVGSEDTGAVYTFIDKGALPDVQYHYWLQEVELTGWTVIYGPVTGKVDSTDDDDDDRDRFYFHFIPFVANS